MTMPLVVLAAVLGASPLERAAVGEWVSYELDGGGGRVSYVRFAAVGTEQDLHGREAVWLELEVAHDPRFVSPIARLSVLAARREGLTPGGVTRLVLAVAAGQPIELSPQELDRFWPAASVKRPDPGPRGVPLQLRTASRAVMTGVGTLTAECTDATARGEMVHTVCASEAVPLVGLVELRMPGVGQAVRLHGSGTAASRRMPVAANPPSIREAR